MYAYRTRPTSASTAGVNARRSRSHERSRQCTPVLSGSWVAHHRSPSQAPSRAISPRCSLLPHDPSGGGSSTRSDAGR